MRVSTKVALISLAALAVGFFLERGLDAGGGKGNEESSHHLTGDMPKDMRMMNDMMVRYLGKKDPNYEKRFIDMMIPHHEGAIRSAKHALEHSNRPELKAMLKKTIEDQEKEIAQLKQWRMEWYGSEK